VQEIEVAKNGSSVFLFQDCAASAARIAAFEGTLADDNFGAASRVGAMPALS